jgi:pimeloyl-CoA synthetase
MDQGMNEQVNIDLTKIKSDITSIKDLPIASHNTEFEKIHKHLQQALTNLDGV